MFYLVYSLSTGEAVSYGSVLADPMPEQFTVRALTNDETAGVREGRLMWDATTLTFVQNLHWVPSDV